MRIVSGKYKGRRFDPPKSFKARPTTDIAKESLFNILNNMIDWEDTTALDLFGGTGSISFELISRGCPRVVCVEKNFNHTSFIEKIKSDLKIGSEMQLVKTDVFVFLEHYKEQFDLIFADPPYDLKNFEDVPRLIFEKGLLRPDGIFILEHSKEYDFSEYLLFKEKRVYGSVNFSLFTPIE
ncbi:16S rRNA (guanine(966)-N(2))-methyltransferase RsmD [Dysgonomonas hofstadii]|uniref:16S rRNA (Guanine(966)-N(2))-methyltransferase RsmD n=1 Tax=Dysgonomonas hofstadii TaxID=637886 RepID=A0A840CZG2_9BACT|nr:RsmD family RNA methyltransferase [Dysgonomonas hofstadii]MBB4037792.1 16S rRNA (guanine(966)-N(2))-methyltransferase RsmD [Dysgonomonas hofstadii]